MPVVLPEPAGWEAWLDPALDGPAASPSCLRPLAIGSARACDPRNPLVNSVANDGPGCLEPELTLL